MVRFGMTHLFFFSCRRRFSSLSKRMTIHESHRLSFMLRQRSAVLAAAVGNQRSISSHISSSEQKYDEKYLQLQIQRQIDRVLQKISKLTAAASPSSSSASSSSTASSSVDQTKLETLQERHRLLLYYQETLTAAAAASSVPSRPLSPQLLIDFTSFGLQLFPPVRVKQQPSSPSSSPSPSSKPRVEPRKPFKLFASADALSIFVGRSAQENDVISLSSQYCHPDDWWLHVAHHPGSHIIIKYQSDDLQSVHPQSLYDAAVLAIHFSKSSPSSLSPSSSSSSSEVTVTRGKYLSKQRGDPPGRVMLTKIVQTIAIHSSSQKYKRTLQRLLEQNP
jgi:predicted ribosome quality control (RQC) complex YloA/Tae2 family protein